MKVASAACPGLHTLDQYLHDHLVSDDASRIDVHIDGCPSCQGRLNELIGELPDYLPCLSFIAPRSATARPVEETAPELTGFATVARLATGGMGVVWRVYDLQFERTLAIKVMKRQASRQADQVQRFFQEARLCAQLAHPYIVPIHAMGRLDDGRPYYTMKLVEGETLAARLGRRQSSDPFLFHHDLMELLQIFSRLCQAMAFAHREGVIHRDLKPHNIMLGEHGEVQLMDWGLAKIIDESPLPADPTNLAAIETPPNAPPWEPGAADEPATGSTNRSQRPTLPTANGQRQQRFATQAGDVMGTLAYMPPEQARGDVAGVDRRSDVFGLGSILCEILTGAPAYAGSDFWLLRTAAAEAHLDDALARLATCGADAELIELAERMLSADKLDRPASAEVVSDAIAAYLKAAEQRSRQAELARLAAARPVNVVRRQWQRCRQRPLRSAVAAALATTIVLLTFAMTRPAPQLRVGIKPWVGFSPLAVADDLKLCPGIDLVLQPVEDHDDALQKLSRGEIDAVLCPLEGHVFARAAGHSTKAILKLDDSLSADAIVARDSIQTPSDLIGKKLVYVQMDAPHFLLLAFAERHGLAADAVTLVAAKTAAEAMELFIHGEAEGIAAVAIYEPYLQTALQRVPGAHVLTTAQREGGAIVDILTIDETYLSDHPRRVEALAAGWFEAIRLLNGRDPMALASARQFLAGKGQPPVSEAQYEAMTAGMKYSDRNDNARFFARGLDGQSEFRRRMFAAHARLSQWNFLRDTTNLDVGDADGSAVLSAMFALRFDAGKVHELADGRSR